jgi:abequosyltransferase
MKSPTLSICIPTYNRSKFLRECLESLGILAPDCLNQIEVVVSDNASTDDTESVVQEFLSKLPIKYFRNPQNIGPERNIMAVAARANTPYVWIFGDDDVFEEDSIPVVLKELDQGYDLVVLNFSSWSRDMGTMLRARKLPLSRTTVFNNRESVMTSLSVQLGYISCMIMKREVILSAPLDEYEPFIQYGFSHLYALYAGLSPACRAKYLAQPLFKNREENSDVFLSDDGLQNWIKYFIYGTAIVLDALQEKGYSRNAVIQGKELILRDIVQRAILGGLGDADRREVLQKSWRKYQWNWRYWCICVPALFTPRWFLRRSRAVFLILRDKLAGHAMPRKISL